MKHLVHGFAVAAVVIGGAAACAQILAPRWPATCHGASPVSQRSAPDTVVVARRGDAHVVGAVTDTPHPAVSDAAIMIHVSSALRSAPGVQAGHIEVEVSSGVVALSGIVNDVDQERRAVTIAAGIGGVKDVRSWIQVQ